MLASLFTLIDRSRPVLVALSGGADSVALLHMLVTAGYQTVAAHCNFHLRGEESDSDEAFVHHLCRQLNVTLHVKQFDTRSYAADKQLSIEMAARDLRYEWFAQLLADLDIPLVAVAHHADDNAETLLLNLTRGTGLKGLAGMAPLNGRIVRPLLNMSRADIELYCQLNALKFVTDSTNDTDDVARNRIRHHVIPELKAINPSFLTTMTANMRHFKAIYDLFVLQVAEFARQHVSYKGNVTRIDATALAQLTDAEPYIFELLKPRGFSPTAIHNLADAIARNHSGATFLADNATALVDHGSIVVTSTPIAPDSTTYSIPSLQQLPFTAENVTLNTFDIQQDYQISRDPNRLHLDADKAKFPLTLRHWLPGDVFRPLGLEGRKKLSDIFVDLKLSLHEKNAVFLLVDAEGSILALAGIRPADNAKVTNKTKRIIELLFHQ